MGAAPALVDDATVARLLRPADVLGVIGRAFTDPLVAPARAVAECCDSAVQTRALLAMPALRPAGLSTVKVVTALGGQAGGLSSHLFAFNMSGQLLAVIEADHLTALRTAAASVFAARALGAGHARHLAVLGAGRQARAHVEAYTSALDLETVTIWGRRSDAAAALAGEVAPLIKRVRTAATASEAISGADVVVSATSSHSPIIEGRDLRSGAHLDLVGGFRPTMREADDAAVARSAVVADTAAALDEAGDLVQPIASGILQRDDVRLLADVLAGRAPVPRRDLTLFKSVGHAREDLVVAELLLARLGLGQVPLAVDVAAIGDRAGARR